jgi:hypothetical protein
MEEKRNAYRNATRRETTMKTRHRGGNNIKVGIKETGWGGMDWIHLAKDRTSVVDSCEHSNEPLSSIKWWEILG